MNGFDPSGIEISLPFLQGMNFFHFGPDHQLFGSYLPAPRNHTAQSVAVLCYPFGQEYMRAHRAFKQLATLLSRRGVPVFRFDYSGTGDSGGEGEDAQLAQWIRDTNAAIDEAKQRSACRQVRLVGLRLGALVASLTAAARTDVERLVLWDPVVRGAQYVQELEQHIGLRENGLSWVHGYPLSTDFRNELEQVDLRTVRLQPDTQVHQMHSHENAEFDALTSALALHVGGARSQLLPAPSDWNYADKYGGLLMPGEFIKGVVQAMAD
jgi:pimeloyl-ACP methyl ester carboxylesterase